MLNESRKKAIAREKIYEAELKSTATDQPKPLQGGGDSGDDDKDSDDALDLDLQGVWLEPESRIMRRKAKQMRGVRSDSVVRLEYDDQHQVSAQRPYTKIGRQIIPHPFGRRLIEDR